jgi:hypothetical protein
MSTVPKQVSGYKVGGSLGFNHPTYVTRQADQDLLEALKSGQFCYVFNCRQMGKSSLRVRAMHLLKTEGMCSGYDQSGKQYQCSAMVQRRYLSIISGI